MALTAYDNLLFVTKNVEYLSTTYRQEARKMLEGKQEAWIGKHMKSHRDKKKQQ